MKQACIRCERNLAGLEACSGRYLVSLFPRHQSEISHVENDERERAQK